MNVKAIIESIEKENPRAQKDKAIKAYALEILKSVDDKEREYTTYSDLLKTLLNGAETLKEYNESGNTLIYDEDIAKRILTPAQLKQKKGGNLPPNRWQTWLELQNDYLIKAFVKIKITGGFM